MEYVVTHKAIDLKELWEERTEALAVEQARMEEYNAMEIEHRAAIEDILVQMLETMKGDMTWVPPGFSVDKGSVIDIHFRILFSDITENILAKREEELLDIAAARDGAAKMVEEIRGES